MCMCNTYVYIYIHIHIYIHKYIYVYISYEIYIYYHIRDIYIALIQCQIIGDGKPWKAHIPNIIQTILRTGNTLELLYIYVYLFAGLLGYIQFRVTFSSSSGSSHGVLHACRFPPVQHKG